MKVRQAQKNQHHILSYVWTLTVDHEFCVFNLKHLWKPGIYKMVWRGPHGIWGTEELGKRRIKSHTMRERFKQ